MSEKIIDWIGIGLIGTSMMGMGCDVGKVIGRSEVCRQMGYQDASLRDGHFVCYTRGDIKTFIPGAGK